MSRTLTLPRSEISRLNLMFLAALGLLLGIPVASSAEDQPIAQQVAKTFGLDSFGQIEAMRYTWNAEFPGGHQLSHKWEWVPKTNTVSYEGKDKTGNPVKVTYQRSQPDSLGTVSPTTAAYLCTLLSRFRSVREAVGPCRQR